MGRMGDETLKRKRVKGKELEEKEELEEEE